MQYFMLIRPPINIWVCLKYLSPEINYTESENVIDNGGFQIMNQVWSPGQRYDGYSSTILVKNRYLDDFSPHLCDFSV